ncbi:hotdog fold thioesterase [Methanotrichaceae archaeon M04Ac]|uniref:Hotdog fold thioesterase n=1 Tax=Candidatus Methanocrinis alkalitolerans TaxID=3033395 RepID=A0ABT5XC12_9EURY|nr:hotdog fold thioesterase [Candidatus Methanocrinis alkalitolerans]MCR3884858.1 PaaI family thioesterase [Methanothrix sp.]MDF0592248.1 hotdog fold thioesterase [Candidatus Methanocrinis alkalitolerans]
MGEEIFKAIQKRVEEEAYAKKMGLELVEVEEGRALVEMEFTEDMENIFGMAHGGAIFSLIDEAFEVAANSHGTVSVALSMTVNYVSSPKKGDSLLAEAREVNRSNRIGTYEIHVRREEGDLIAVCQALVYRKREPLPFL